MINRKYSVDTFYQLMEKLSDRLQCSNQQNIENSERRICNVDESWYIGEGETKCLVDSVTFVTVGIRERQDVEIDDDMFFMMGLVSCYHEIEHVIQILNYQHCSGDFAQMLTVNNIACGTNKSFYEDNYSRNPRELDAQLYGIYAAYIFCCYHFGTAGAERLMCHYANTCAKMKMPVMFPSPKGNYTSAHEVFQVLNVKLQESLTVHREFHFKKMLAHSKENFAVDFLKNAKVMGRYPYADQIRNTQDGFEQEKMIAAISLEHSLMQSQKQRWLDLESLKGLDLNRSSLFDSGKLFVPHFRKNAPRHTVCIHRLQELEFAFEGWTPEQ